MSGTTDVDRRTQRRQASVDEIVAAAWELSRTHGLTGFSMRTLGARVGMRAQSLYSYFSSKHELYDAMFAGANRDLLAWLREPAGSAADADPVAAIARGGRRFFEFCVQDPVRYQLLFQRTIPDFVPSDESMALAREAYEASLAPLRDLGLGEAELDLATAVMSGLTAQQLANDPGGDRWERLLDRATAMLLRELAPDAFDTRPRRDP